MGFYEEWLSFKNTESEEKYIKTFLANDMLSTNVFYYGSEADLGVAISIIDSVSIDQFVKTIDALPLEYDIASSQVPQFSDFTDGAYRIAEILEFAEEGLTFEKIGYQLVKSPTDGAGIKYGENHSKLANLMDLVKIEKRPSNVRSTALGKYLVKFLPEEKNELLKRLLLRQCLLQKMIKESKNATVSYRGCVGNLSQATALRRRNNVKVLLDFILKGTDQEYRIDNVDWRV